MTVILAVVDGEHVHMGADSAVQKHQGHTAQLARSKLWCVTVPNTVSGSDAQLVVGFTGSLAVESAFRYMQWPVIPVLAKDDGRVGCTDHGDDDVFEAWLNACVVPALRRVLLSNFGIPSYVLLGAEKNVPADVVNFELLIGVTSRGFRGRIFRVEGTGAVVEEARGWSAVGSGTAFAVGAMLALEFVGAFVPTSPAFLNPHARIEAALVAACKGCFTCGTPLTFCSAGPAAALESDARNATARAETDATAAKGCAKAGGRGAAQ